MEARHELVDAVLGHLAAAVPRADALADVVIGTITAAQAPVLQQIADLREKIASLERALRRPMTA